MGQCHSETDGYRLSKITNPFEIYKILPKTNCRECQLPTCLAFAAAVLKQEKRLDHCPHLEPGVIARLEGRIEKPVSMEGIMEEVFERLKQEIRTIDLSSRAEELGAAMTQNKFVVKCLGKNFVIDEKRKYCLGMPYPSVVRHPLAKLCSVWRRQEHYRQLGPFQGTRKRSLLGTALPAEM